MEHAANKYIKNTHTPTPAHAHAHARARTHARTHTHTRSLIANGKIYATMYILVCIHLVYSSLLRILPFTINNINL